MAALTETLVVVEQAVLILVEMAAVLAVLAALALLVALEVVVLEVTLELAVKGMAQILARLLRDLAGQVEVEVGLEHTAVLGAELD